MGKSVYTYQQPRYTQYYNTRRWDRQLNRYVDEVKELPPHLRDYDETYYRRKKRLEAREKRQWAAENAKERWGHRTESYWKYKIPQGKRPMGTTWLTLERKKQLAKERLAKTRSTRQYWAIQKSRAKRRLAQTRARKYEAQQAALRKTRKPAYTFVKAK